MSTGIPNDSYDEGFKHLDVRKTPRAGASVLPAFFWSRVIFPFFNGLRMRILVHDVAAVWVLKFDRFKFEKVSKTCHTLLYFEII